MSLMGRAAAEALTVQAETYLHERRPTSALRAFDCAEAAGASPDRCAAGRWLVQMLLGNFEAAWRESDAIRARGAPDPHHFWQGERIEGRRVILRCLHGLGDAVQFLRYAPALRAIAADLTVEVSPALLDLAPMFEGVGAVVTWGEDAPARPPTWDVQVEINELPYLFRTTAEHLPIRTRYLHLPESVLRKAAPVARKGSSFRVGLVWESGGWNRSRSVPLKSLQTVSAMEGCEFWNLQGGAARTQWNTMKNRGNLHEAACCGHSVVHLAALIGQLDLVITPDTLAAHLAGALGTPAWVMLEHAADWRWQHGRSDSPWYPSLRLFRQPSVGDWSSVVRAVRQELDAITDRRLIA